MITTLPRLTCVQRDVLDFCAEYIDRWGQFPTYREICDVMGWASQSTAFGVVDQLVSAGAIERTRRRGASRGFALTEAGLAVVSREVLWRLIEGRLRPGLRELAGMLGERRYTVTEFADMLGASLEE